MRTEPGISAIPEFHKYDLRENPAGINPYLLKKSGISSGWRAKVR
jgi:hypothetical protein